ncbi:MAG TPA: hypothetical protein VMJ70_09360 [Candidatus Sulfotelmatobacter sp.]|nr:hypothetical protein [Candidatus Sulfotelmatobacter sp.]
MIPTEYERLLQEALDGEATAAERERLAAWLATHPEGRARRAELQALFDSLGRTPPAETPSDLRGAVLAEIRARRTQAQPSPRPAGRSPIGRRPLFAVLTPFAMGLLAGVLGFAAFTGRFGRTPSPSTDVSGSMAPLEQTRGDALTLNQGTARLEAFLTEGEGTRRLGLRLTPEASVVVEITYDPAVTSVVALRSPEGADASVQLSPGLVRFNPGTGGRFELELKATGSARAPLQLALVSPGGRAQGTLPPPTSPRR